MSVTSITARMQSERRTVPAQAKLTESESLELDGFVEFWRANGIPDATRSSAIRALVLDGLAAFRDFREEGATT